MADQQAGDGVAAPAAAAATNGTSKVKQEAAATATKNDGQQQHRSPKKRRKVNHACVYCRRSHMTCDLARPCTRCIKRNIGHLCHDEPREADNKKPKTASSSNGKQEDTADTPSDMGRSSISSSMGPPAGFDGGSAAGVAAAAANNRPRASSSGFNGPMLGQRATLPLVQQQQQQQQQQAGMQSNPLGQAMAGEGGNANQFAGFSDAWMTAQNFGGLNSYNPNYLIAPEVSHEFNLLNDFLHTSLLDDNMTTDDAQQQSPAFASGNDLLNSSTFGSDNNDSTWQPQQQQKQQAAAGAMLPPPNVDGKTIVRPPSAAGGVAGAAGSTDKTRQYYLQAADPEGSDNPEERMDSLLRAKYDAGLLKPFNYINGYARLGKYLDGHIAASSKQKILRTINQFRPKFREKAEGLNDIQLVYVEMWFERQLMDYDRVFASMAVPACCWRRTGEIFRGNKEMAELIGVPVDRLRDGKIALHEILTEESMVRYWEEFGTIAFDPAHETLLTACSLKNPSDTSNRPVVNCCFAFTIRRDEHKLPALIVGNFLPHDPPPQG